MRYWRFYNLGIDQDCALSYRYKHQCFFFMVWVDGVFGHTIGKDQGHGAPMKTGTHATAERARDTRCYPLEKHWQQLVVYLGVVLLEASRREEDEAGEVGGLPLQAPGDSIDEQGGASQAVPHSPQPVGLPLLATALLLVPATVAAASAACLAALLAFDPDRYALQMCEGP